MKRGRDLYEAVQEDFLVTLSVQPHFFQSFVSLEKLSHIEQVNTFGHFLFHCGLLRDGNHLWKRLQRGVGQVWVLKIGLLAGIFP